jgi:hypothetical protein
MPFPRSIEWGVRKGNNTKNDIIKSSNSMYIGINQSITHWPHNPTKVKTPKPQISQYLIQTTMGNMCSVVQSAQSMALSEGYFLLLFPPHKYSSAFIPFKDP